MPALPYPASPTRQTTRHIGTPRGAVLPSRRLHQAVNNAVDLFLSQVPVHRLVDHHGRRDAANAKATGGFKREQPVARGAPD